MSQWDYKIDQLMPGPFPFPNSRKGPGVEVDALPSPECVEKLQEQQPLTIKRSQPSSAFMKEQNVAFDYLLTSEITADWMLLSQSCRIMFTS